MWLSNCVRFFLKYFIAAAVLVFIALPLSAADNAGKAEIAYSEGVLAYHDHQYAVAVTQLSKALQLNPQHGPAAYFLGLSYLQQGNTAAAQTALDTAVRLQPDTAEPYFYRGLAQYRAGTKDLAMADFKKAKSLTKAGPIWDLSQSYMRNIDAGDDIAIAAETMDTGKPWYVYASLSTSYDSNVSLSPNDLTLASLPSNKTDADFELRAGGGYHLIRNKNFKLTPEAFYYQSLHPRLDGFNYGLTHVGLQNQVMLGSWTIAAPVAYEYSVLGSSKFLGNVIMDPTVSYFWGERLLTQIGSQVMYNDFFQTVTSNPQDRDAWNAQPQIAQYVYFNDKKHYAGISYNYEKNWASGNDWDYHANTIVVSTLLPLPKQLDLYLFGSFTFNKNFDNIDSIIGTRRKDTLYMAGANLSRKWLKYLETSVHYNYYKNESNQAFFTYDRSVAGVTFGVAY